MHTGELEIKLALQRVGELLTHLREATLDVIWRQWRAIGGQAATTQGPARSIVDPEALILISLEMSLYEPRLRDVVRDWVVLNSRWLSVQRVKNLTRPYSANVRQLVSFLARDAVIHGHDARWQGLAVEAYGAPDDSHVLRTNKWRALRARFQEPGALLLRLRLGFGVGAKADILGMLLGVDRKWTTIREIVGATGYMRAGVRRAVDELAAASFVDARVQAPAAYHCGRDAWVQLLQVQGDFPRWRSWHERFVVILDFMNWANGALMRPTSAYALGVMARELVERHREALERDSVTLWRTEKDSAGALTSPESILEALRSWLSDFA